MKKILFIATFILALSYCKAQSQVHYVYNVYNHTTYVSLIDSTKTDSTTYPINTMSVHLYGGKLPQLYLTTKEGQYIASWDTTNVYILAPKLDSGYRKLNAFIY